MTATPEKVLEYNMVGSLNWLTALVTGYENFSYHLGKIKFKVQWLKIVYVGSANFEGVSRLLTN